ncbi:MAG: hypothetical protein ACLP7Q_04790 [Isosphaeraceae bacterium]
MIKKAEAINDRLLKSYPKGLALGKALQPRLPLYGSVVLCYRPALHIDPRFSCFQGIITGLGKAGSGGVRRSSSSLASFRGLFVITREVVAIHGKAWQEICRRSGPYGQRQTRRMRPLLSMTQHLRNLDEGSLLYESIPDLGAAVHGGRCLPGLCRRVGRFPW